MPLTKYNTHILILVYILSIVAVICMGCNGVPTTPDKRYKTYEMKADDIRLQYCNHPLFTFEYPAIFHLTDVYQVPQTIETSDHSDVFFTFFQSDDLPLMMLWIRVQKPWPGYYINASEEVQYLISERSSITNDITTTKVKVSGIDADYFKSFQKVEKEIADSELSYTYNYSYRAVLFDYSGLIWQISISWFYYGSEPPEVNEYFNHVIETFKILD